MQFFISISIYWNAELWCIELFVLIKSAETKKSYSCKNTQYNLIQ